MDASVFILSYPSLTNAQGEAPGRRQALEQWLALCDQITRAGGTILLLDPPSMFPTAKATGDDWVQTSRLGSVFVGARADGSVGAMFLRARRDHEASGPAWESLGRQLASMGLTVRDASQVWGGQADLLGLPRNRFLVSHGASAVDASCDAVTACLPLAAHVLRVPVVADSGLAAFAYLQTVGGSRLLLVDSRVLQGVTVAQIAAFAGDKVQVLSLGAEDAAAGATQLLCVHGTALVPPGISTTLRGHLWRLGFQVVEVDLRALSAPTVAVGPRAFVVAWPQCVLDDAVPTYAVRRGELFQRLSQLSEA